MRTVDCPECGAHFALPEDLYERKVAGRKTNVRCKVCGERLELDGTRAGIEDLWVVSVGEDDRELSTSQVSDALRSGEIDSSAIVWKEGMDDWETVDKIERFAPALADRGAADSGTDVAVEASRDGFDSKSEVAADATESGDSAPTESDDSAPTESGDSAPTESDDSAPTESPSDAESRARALFGPNVGAAPEARVVAAETPASDVETAPAVPVVVKPVRDSEMHALFAVESMPPGPVDLDDSDMRSLPPSDVPPLFALRSPMVVPKAPRAPLRDLIGPVSESAVVIAPPSAGALTQVTPDAPEVEASSPDLEIPVDEDLDAPVEEDVTVPETVAAKRARAGGESAGRGRWGLLVLVLAVALVAFFAFGSWRRPSPNVGGATAVATGEPERAPRVSGSVVAVASSSNGLGEQPDETAPAASPAGPAARSPSVTGSTSGRLARSSASETADSGHRVPTPSKPAPKESRGAEQSTATSTFDKSAAIAALTAAASAASSCRRGADPSGTATVFVTFAPSGRVTSANLSGPPFAGTATGGCIAAQMRTARVPRFSGSHVTVSKRVVIY